MASRTRPGVVARWLIEMSNKRTVVHLEPERAVARVLTPDYWLRSLEVRCCYSRRQDDTDGQRDHAQNLDVTIGPDGDCWLTAGGGQTLRFRTWAGGGMSVRTRQALMVLAEAIRLDNEELPQH